MYVTLQSYSIFTKASPESQSRCGAAEVPVALHRHPILCLIWSMSCVNGACEMLKEALLKAEGRCILIQLES